MKWAGPAHKQQKRHRGMFEATDQKDRCNLITMLMWTESQVFGLFVFRLQNDGETLCRPVELLEFLCCHLVRSACNELLVLQQPG